MRRVFWLAAASLILGCGGGSEHHVPAADAGPDARPDGGRDPDAATDRWDVTVTVEVGADATPVGLAEIERTTFEGAEAVRVTRIVESLALELPWSFLYDFVGSDGFDPLAARMDGDRSGLPHYGELDQGFVFWEWDDEAQADRLRVGWDEALGFPGYLSVSAMAGGTIVALGISADELLVQAGDVRSLVDLTTLPTTEIVDHAHPEEGNKTVVTLPDVFSAAGLADASALEFEFLGQDGFSSGENNLMPFENASHAYVELANKQIHVDEAWDSDVCCWDVYEVVLIRGR